MVTARVFVYVGDMISTGGGFKATVTVRTSVAGIKFRECGELLCGKLFPLTLKGTVCKSCVVQCLFMGVKWDGRERK